MNWFYWDTYLKGGKHKANTVERPMPSGGQTHRVVRLSDGSIGLKLHHTYCVIFHQDGTVTYDTGGWNTVTTKRFINDNGPVCVFSEKYDLRLNVKIGTKPPRVQKCRRCHGKGQVPIECHGPSWCYPPTWRSEPCRHGETSNHRPETCTHGQRAYHVTGEQDCYQCQGSGRYDYGSQAIWLPWHGGAYRFHPDDPATEVQTYYSTPVPADAPGSTVESGQSYGDSGAILTALMPDIKRVVSYPCGRRDGDCSQPAVGKDDSPYEGKASVHDVIIHLNDTDRWTRERIADWLDTLDLDLRFPVPTT